MHDQLSDATLATLDNYLNPARSPSDHLVDQAALQDALVRDFNRVLGGGSIYDPRALPVSLGTETLALLVQFQSHCLWTSRPSNGCF